MKGEKYSKETGNEILIKIELFWSLFIYETLMKLRVEKVYFARAVLPDNETRQTTNIGWPKPTQKDIFCFRWSLENLKSGKTCSCSFRFIFFIIIWRQPHRILHNQFITVFWLVKWDFNNYNV